MPLDNLENNDNQNNDNDNQSNDQALPPAEPTNSDFKSTPAYQAMAQQIAELNKEKSDRAAADEAAKNKAEQESLIAKGEFDKALELHKKQLEDTQAEHAQELLQRDLKSELYRVGFSNEMFVNGAVASYKEGDVTEYVKALSDNEANNPFKTQTQQNNSLPTPNAAPVNGRKLTADQIKQMESSPDQKVRLQAIEYKKSQYDQGAVS